MFNCKGELSKILFGTMDDDDAKYYNEQIQLFEQNSEDMNTLLIQQLSIVRSSLGAVNNTLADVEYNENLLKEGVSRVAEYMNTLRSETNEKMNLFSAKSEIERHILRVNNAMSTLQHNLDLFIDSVINAHVTTSGIHPSHLDGSINEECVCFPKRCRSTFPFEQGLSTLNT